MNLALHRAITVFGNPAMTFSNQGKTKGVMQIFYSRKSTKGLNLSPVII
jgi:hypothetical protein